jgi:hypothetical protein
MAHDKKYLKIYKMTKNPIVGKEILTLIEKNFKILNELFLTVAMSDGHFPTIKMASYLKFCHDAKLSCSHVTMTQIAVHFVSANFEISD